MTMHLLYITQLKFFKAILIQDFKIIFHEFQINTNLDMFNYKM